MAYADRDDEYDQAHNKTGIGRDEWERNKDIEDYGIPDSESNCGDD